MGLVAPQHVGSPRTRARTHVPCVGRRILFFLILFIYWLIDWWLCWVFVSAWGLSPLVASGGHSSSWCAGLSLSRPLLLRSTGSTCAGSAIVAHGPSRSLACGIFPDQGSNPCSLHRQADSQPLRHQGSPTSLFLFIPIKTFLCQSVCIQTAIHQPLGCKWSTSALPLPCPKPEQRPENGGYHYEPAFFLC